MVQFRGFYNGIKYLTVYKKYLQNYKNAKVIVALY